MSAEAVQRAELRRDVSAHIEAELSQPESAMLAIAVAGGHDREHEELRATLDGSDLEVTAVDAPHRGRLHLLRGVGPGRLVLSYQAAVVDSVAPAVASDLEWFEYIRPSRYCESDRLGPLARSEFAGLKGADLVAGISSWVGENIDYVPGSSRPIDGAVATLLARRGVCRDFAHLTAALLRANDISARVVSVYAPGLDPMDFHAVTEACLDGVWHVVDPTCLAPRQSMVRIATGADAADTAFLTNVGGALELVDLTVTAVAQPSLPRDDTTRLTELR